ncbi:MAG: hypothetical protein RLZZ09_1404 [Pseudomonadota bacterium]
MNRLVFHVQGSAAQPYRVTFEKTGNNLNGYCTCPAGDKGQHCKHRTNILYGVIDGIINPDFDDLCQLGDWIPGTDVEHALKELQTADQAFKEAEARLKVAKKNLSIALRS